MGWAKFWAIFFSANSSGIDVMILKICLPKNLAKNWRF
jgi:hypothetical protein